MRQIEYPPPEIVSLVSGGDGIHARKNEVRAVVADGFALEVDQRADEETARDQEHEGNRDLDGDERLGAAPAAADRTARIILQRLLRLATRAAERRQQTEDHAARDRHAGRERKNP